MAVAIIAPMLAAALIIPAIAGSARLFAALGLAPVRVLDLLIGTCLALVMRAAVELVAPTVATGAGWLADEMLVSLIVAVLVSPVVEELLFRGVLQRALADGLRKSGPLVAAVASIVATTAAFTAAHAMTGTVQYVTIVATVAVGTGCGIMTAWTGRLGAAITAHLFYNAIGAALMLG
ncbi:CPBP family intramembrane glutamic endopeptidase [Microbacterium sp. NPDC058345]|uniref:CPBP family intramembrane glutamic endopeptidase n=1 Tax=Microbacterium sp. NPDC058345 TaxID=3346455 RepID=UPI003667053A